MTLTRYPEDLTSPFLARLFVAQLEMKDQFVLIGLEGDEKDAKRAAYDPKFDKMFSAARSARDAAREICEILGNHPKAIVESQAVVIRNGQIVVNDPIDIPLGQAFDKLVNQSWIAIKNGLQTLLRTELGLDIGFLFQKSDSKFSEGIKALWTASEHDLATYLEDVRATWTSALGRLRNDLEHHDWSLGRVRYQIEGNFLAIGPPEVEDMRVDVYATHTANRVLLFIENMMVYAIHRRLNQRFKGAFFVSEIPKNQRDPASPKRFVFQPTGLSGARPWTIAYRDERDFV
jgi:hypothetical protein